MSQHSPHFPVRELQLPMQVSELISMANKRLFPPACHSHTDNTTMASPQQPGPHRSSSGPYLPPALLAARSVSHS